MAEAAGGGGGGTATVTESATEPEQRSVTLRLRKRPPRRRVEWSSDTVDNEHLGRRSSKCCCIYEKPRAFGESSTESEEEEGEEGEGGLRAHSSPRIPPSESRPVLRKATFPRGSFPNPGGSSQRQGWRHSQP
ncbi:E3 ubiquitin-protein ligase PPP1R11 [Eudromia elegans]